jgi:Family of unknown function (DUF5681)
MTFKKGQSGNPAGKKPGTPNKTTTALREQILESLDRAGGIEYLQWLAKNYPGPFCSLLGKVLPTTIACGDSGPVNIVLEQRIVRPEPKLTRITQSRSV